MTSCTLSETNGPSKLVTGVLPRRYASLWTIIVHLLLKRLPLQKHAIVRSGTFTSTSVRNTVCLYFISGHAPTPSFPPNESASQRPTPFQTSERFSHQSAGIVTGQDSTTLRFVDVIQCLGDWIVQTHPSIHPFVPLIVHRAAGSPLSQWTRGTSLGTPCIGC